MRAMLADLVLYVHFGLAAFVSLGLFMIWLGIGLKWRWTRNRTFRLLHLGVIGFIAMEAIAGIACPLTVWEDSLRHASGASPGFIGRWVQRLLFYDLPSWVFTAVYVAAALATVVAWKIAPPRRIG